MDSQTPGESFSKLKSWMFPIYRNELKKVIPLGLMMVLISFNFWILHISKDTLVISAKHSGAEIINFLKLPIFIFSIFFVMFYAWLSNKFHQKTIFFTIVGFFFLFFSCFNFFIYPNKEVLNLFTPDEIAHLKETYPWIKWMFPVIGYWGYSLFYIFSELWGALVLTLLFWQFANNITTVEQSRRFYMLIGMFNGVGTIFSGFFVTLYSHHSEGSVDCYGDKLHDLLLIFSLLCIGIVAIYHWIHKNVEVPTVLPSITQSKKKSKNKVRLSFVESFKYILKSRYVGYIALISISYNISINFVEVTWKSQVRELYQDPLAIEHYFSQITIYIGILVFIIGFFGAGFVRRFSWRLSASITPIIMTITGLLFFMIALGKENLSWLADFFQIAPLALTVWVGQVHNLASRSCKYSFFAATKEMAFIPLDAELKVKGKAAVDILSGRLGKFGGSLVQSLLLSIPCFATQIAIAPYLLVFLLVIFVVWVLAINLLNKEFLRVAYGHRASKDEDEAIV